MNSSERSTSVVRQSRSLVGSVELSRRSATLRLLVQPGADARLHLGDDLLEQQRRLCLVARLVDVRRAVSSVSTTRATMPGPRWSRTSLVCPRTAAPRGRTVTTAVMPASTSSFSGLSLPTLSRRPLARAGAGRPSTALLEGRPRACRPGRRDDVDEGLHPHVVAPPAGRAQCQRHTRARAPWASCAPRCREWARSP